MCAQNDCSTFSNNFLHPPYLPPNSSRLRGHLPPSTALGIPGSQSSRPKLRSGSHTCIMSRSGCTLVLALFHATAAGTPPAAPQPPPRGRASRASTPSSTPPPPRLRSPLAVRRSIYPRHCPRFSQLMYRRLFRRWTRARQSCLPGESQVSAEICGALCAKSGMPYRLLPILSTPGVVFRPESI
jgi:hypothetical protein